MLVYSWHLMEPLVNILLPTYEPASRHLTEAIESVLKQTEQRWTLLIHDDASMIDVRAIAEPYLRDPRIAFARSRHRRGIGGNWNAAYRMSHTAAPFVQYLFQDDTWHPLYLERALQRMEQYPDIGFVAAQHDYRFEGQCPVQRQYETTVAVRRDLIAPGKHDGTAFLQWWLRRGLHPNIIGEPSFVLLRRSLVERVGGFAEDMPQVLDVEYWVRILPNTAWYNLEGSHGTFRVHASGASARNREEGEGLFDRLCCIERATRMLPPSSRAHARATVEHQLQEMILKFLRRREDGSQVSYGGSATLPRFALRHPVLSLRALRGALARRKRPLAESVR